MSSTSTASSLPPVIFNARGSKPDVRLEVFNTIFHVHSSILKLNSPFFFTLFDSPDKLQGPTFTDGFKYEWVTKVVDDGEDWQLVCKGPNAGELDVLNFKGSQEDQTKCFSKPLSAFYGQRYSLSSCKEFFTMTDLARFYAALPAISRSLSSTFFSSPGFIKEIRACACELLVAATELRHPVLFREALILTLGPWTDPEYRRLTDPMLKKVARNAYNALGAKVARVHEKILIAMYAGLLPLQMGAFREITENSKAAMVQIRKDRVPLGSHGYWGSPLLSLPRYYRKLYECGKDKYRDVEASVGPLLKNNLVLYGQSGRHPNSDVEPGWEIDYFLCVKIDDEDLPWDTTQTDW